MKTIQLKRGLRANLPSEAAIGEPLFCTDTGELFMGMGVGITPVKVKGENEVGELGSLFTDSKTDIVSAINELFQSVSDGKNLIATAITDKGIFTNGGETFPSLAYRIGQIITDSKRSKTKLNVTAPYTHTITLTNPIAVEDLCTSVIKFTPGPTGITQYVCDFNNGDSNNFEYSPDIYYDGVMKMQTTVINETVNSKTQDTEEFFTLQSSLIDKSLWNTIDTLSIERVVERIDIDVKGTHFPQVVFAKNDIDLSGVESIHSISWNSISTGNSKALLLVTFDSGNTWKTFINNQWVDVDKANIQEVENKGMNASAVTGLSYVSIEEVRNGSNKIRFAYFLKQTHASEYVGNDSITIKINMPGTNSIASPSSYIYTLEQLGTELVYNFTESGTYTINWVASQ